MGFFDILAAKTFSSSVSLYQRVGIHDAPQKAIDPRAHAVFPRTPSHSGAAYGNSGEKWHNGLANSGHTFSINHLTMMLNARRAYHDSPQGRSIIDSLANSIVGTGLKFESAIDYQTLGITQEVAQEVGAQMERRFHLWAQSKRSSRNGLMNFYQVQKLYVKSQLRDGEVFVRAYYNGNRENISPLQLSLVDPTQVQGVGFTTTYGNFAYDDGIIRNDRGEEIAYKIAVQKEAAPFTEEIIQVPAKTQHGRLSMIHGFMPEYAGQKRGYSHIGHILQELQDLKDYELATVAKAAAQSKVMGFEVPSGTAPASGIFDSMVGEIAAGPKQPVEYVPEASKGEFERNVCPIPEATASAPGSMFITNLPAGGDIKFAPNTAPSDKYGDFVDSHMSYLAPSCGVPLEVLKMKWGSSFSASRGTLLQFQEGKESGRGEVAADFLDPVLESFFSEEVAAGNISLPGFSDPVLRSAWLNGRWVGSAVPNIDPVKQANAARANLEMSLTTGERESKNLNGSDFKSNISKNQEAFEMMPIPFWAADKSQPETEPETEEEDGEIEE